MTWAAPDYFEQDDVAAAVRHYREILQLFSNDPVAAAMLRDLSRNLHQKSAIE